LEELDAVLAELGFSDKSNNATQDETTGKLKYLPFLNKLCHKNIPYKLNEA
jgi:uncharacterized protein (DUF1919 family)